MGKDNRESALDKGGASPVDEGPTLVVPEVETKRDEWNIHAAAYRLAAKDSDALVRFYQEHHEIEKDIRRHEFISEDDAKELATRIKELHLSRSFDGREDYRAFLVGQCLKLKEGKSVGDVYAAFAHLEVANPPPAFPERGGPWHVIKLAVPAELIAAFGVNSFAWLRDQSEDFVREHEHKCYPPGSPYSRLYDGGGFGFSLDPESRSSQPEPGAIPVVPTPDEDTIAQFIKSASSRADYWDALGKAAAMLRKRGQPFGDALADWLVEATSRNTPRPKGTQLVQWPEKELRNHAIIQAVKALERCGMKATLDREHGPACDACAKAFGLSASTVRDIWNGRRRDRTREPA